MNWRTTQSTPWRLTRILVAIFVFAILLSFAAAYLVTRNAADRALRLQVSQEFSGYTLETDQIGLEQRVLTQVATIPRGSLILVYLGDTGRRIANVRSFPAVDGYGILRADQIAENDQGLADSYLVVTGRVGRGTLILARSRDQVSRLSDIFTTIFLVSLLPTVAVAAAAGAVVARRANARVAAISDTLQAITNGDLTARVPPFAGAADDLSHIGASVNDMAAAQAASVASLRQVTADIAHDLRTPIQRVAVLLERIEKAGPLNLAQSERLTEAHEETRQIVRTFQSLLQIAQLEGGAAQSHFQPVDLARLVASMADVYEADAEDRGQTLATNISGDGPFVVAGERNLLGVLLANLLENALRHAGKGAQISVELSRDARGISLVCRDSGPGIPAEEHENVLRRLYRLERSRTSEGSGLGLALVKAISDLHGAKLALADNAPGLRISLLFKAHPT